MIDIAICTFEPDLGTLAIVIEALAAQTLSPTRFRVLLVDNASNPPLDACVIEPLRARGIEARLVREDRLGVVHARITAMRSVRSDALLFVDDDNELAPDFLEVALELLETRPELGLFSGRALYRGPEGLPSWIERFQSWLALRDPGPDALLDYGRGDVVRALWFPHATASLTVRRAVFERFLATHGADPRVGEFGRRGQFGLRGDEDVLLATCAAEVGLAGAYEPRLTMYHHIEHERFEMKYLALLLFWGKYSATRRDYFLGEARSVAERWQGLIRTAQWSTITRGKAPLKTLFLISARILGGAAALAQEPHRMIRDLLTFARSPKPYAPAPTPGSAPQILLVNGERASSAHGTGWALARWFQGYPGPLFEASYQGTPDGFFPAVDASALLRPPPPELIYTTVYKTESFEFLAWVHRRSGGRVPVVLHLLDLELANGERAHARGILDALGPRLVEVWAMTRAIQAGAEAWLHRPVKLVFPGRTLPELRPHPPNTRFRPVMIGSIWDPKAFAPVVELWRRLRARHPELPPIQWFGHPRRLRWPGLDLTTARDVIVDAGFAPETLLGEVLERTDLGFVVFNDEDHPGDPYGRYSFPSRCLDWWAYGVPTISFAGRGTEVARWVEQHGLGLVGRASDPKLETELEALVFDAERRRAMGARARTLTEQMLDLEKLRPSFHTALIAAARGAR